MREGGKALGAERLEQLAIEVFEDQDRAAAWMDRPSVALGGKTPRFMSRTDEGCQIAKRVLHAIEHGSVV
ncbi:putative toxin-antitoxin system antitoxin component [compost metagenome]